VAMDEQPATLATPAAVGPGTDAEGVAAATLRFHRTSLDLAAGAAGLAQAGQPATGAADGEADDARHARGRPLAAACPWALTRPAPAPPGPATARRTRCTGRRALAAGPPKAACYISQGSR
jgi:hypothetical protein